MREGGRIDAEIFGAMCSEGEEAEGYTPCLRDLHCGPQSETASQMSPRALVAAAAVLVIALSPSVAECVKAHKDGEDHAWVLWAWVALAVIVAVLFGEELVGSKI